LSHPLSTIGQPFVNLSSVGSTNEEMRNRIKEGEAIPGMVIFTTEQHAGRGQRGKNWVSEKGASIAYSVLLKPEFLTVSQQFLLSETIALAVHDFLAAQVGSDELRIKWPNDIYWKDRKLAGILIESVLSSSGQWQWAIIGIGINVNQAQFAKHLPNPVSIRQITGQQFNCEELAHTLSQQLTHRLQQLAQNEAESLHDRYNQCLYKKGKTASFRKEGKTFNAMVTEVNSGGELILEGQPDPIPFGEVEWLIPST
jgi:BirA family biotin operon repressor/biotin-[acetyl-CoA-carboxylase] ligase